jgi:hypothetical protein
MSIMMCQAVYQIGDFIHHGFRDGELLATEEFENIIQGPAGVVQLIITIGPLNELEDIGETFACQFPRNLHLKGRQSGNGYKEKTRRGGFGNDLSLYVSLKK